MRVRGNPRFEIVDDAKRLDREVDLFVRSVLGGDSAGVRSTALPGDEVRRVRRPLLKFAVAVAVVGLLAFGLFALASSDAEARSGVGIADDVETEPVATTPDGFPLDPVVGVVPADAAVDPDTGEAGLDATEAVVPAAGSLVLVDPAVIDPAVIDPAVIDPGGVGSGVVGSGMVDPAVVERAVVGPAVVDPAVVDPGGAGSTDVPPSDLPVRPDDGWPVRSIRFPVAGPVSFYDDWGDCRGGQECPRHHLGNDIVGVRLQPLLAAADGVVTHVVVDHPTAGWGFVITDAEGWDYRYYHVNNDTPATDDGADEGTWRFAAGIADGSIVRAGQVVAFMGDSGNAEQSVPHVHFEIHRPDGAAIDPHVSLRLAEWVDSCLHRGDGYTVNRFIVSVDSRQTRVVTNGGGRMFIDSAGWFIPAGTARQVGDEHHRRVVPPCDSGYGAIIRAFD